MLRDVGTHWWVWLLNKRPTMTIVCLLALILGRCDSLWVPTVNNTNVDFGIFMFRPMDTSVVGSVADVQLDASPLIAFDLVMFGLGLPQITVSMIDQSTVGMVS